MSLGGSLGGSLGSLGGSLGSLGGCTTLAVVWVVHRLSGIEIELFIYEKNSLEL